MNSLFTLEKLAVCPEAGEAARIAAERLAEIRGEGTSQQVKIAFQEREGEGFDVDISESWDVVIRASRRRDFIAGTGRLLELLLQAINGGFDHSGENGPTDNELAAPAGRWEHIPKHAVRIHYMPGHFGNSFEVAWSREMRRYLEDLVLAGASGYGDWFDSNDMPDPYNSLTVQSTSMVLWRRKKEFLSYSQQLGLDNILILTPNVGFLDQMRPEWLGVRNRQLHVQGQVLCPSKPASREVILQNHQNLFADLQQSNISISKIVCFPYDDGGCACERCQPYYPIFLNLVNDVYRTIQPFYPQLKVDICGWWTSEEESRQLQAFVAGPAKEWFDNFQFSATYGVFELPDVRPQLGDVSLGCFLHIAFSNDRRDVYTTTGIHVAAERVQLIIRSFERQGCHGFMSYNESFSDHYNAFLASQLGWNPDQDIRQITTFYCALILGARGKALQELVDVILDMQLLEEEKAAAWTEALRRLETYVNPHPLQPWAYAHVLSKAELMALDYTIKQKMTVSVEHAIADMEERLALSERLWRYTFGFGVMRRIFPARLQPEWHKQYEEFIGQRTSDIQSQQLSKDA